MQFFQRCPVCTDKYRLEEMREHLLEHYNYCKYGHYHEYELDDPNWPECSNEKPELWEA